jgi:peptidoglycan/xylan/chitin deacetylase (PgdA/CDA1 family)
VRASAKPRFENVTHIEQFMIHQRPSSLIAIPPAFAPPRHDRPSLARTISGKASRFLARNIRTKPLTLRGVRPLVTFTFDDVPLSACTTGAGILEQHGIRGTYYVSGGGCGLTSPCGLLASADHLRALFARGHEISSHTFSHPAVSSIAPDDLDRDLDRNEAFLKGIHGDIAVRNFAYPYGDFSYRSKRSLEGRFDSCRSLMQGVNAGTADLGTLKSWSLENASISRAQIMGVIAEAVQRNGWLIFASHDVDDPPSRFGVTPDLLAFAIMTAKAAGCTFATVADALKIAAGAVTTKAAP